MITVNKNFALHGGLKLEINCQADFSPLNCEMLCMGSKLLTIKGRNTEMTAKFLCLLLSKYFMTKQKIIKAVVGKKETCLITQWKDGMESVSEESHAPRHLEFWMEVSTRLSGIKQKPGTFGFFCGADGITVWGWGDAGPRLSLALWEYSC